MECESCGLDNDPALDHCDSCDHPLRDSVAPVRAGPPPRRSPPPRPAVSLSRPSAVGGLAVLIVAAAAGVVWAMEPDEPSAPAPSPPAATVADRDGPGPDSPEPDQQPDDRSYRQAVALDELLAASGRSRAKLVAANGVAGGCGDLYSAAARLREVGVERRAQRAGLARLDLAALPGGTAARNALDEALRHSLAADENYVEWAQALISNGCRNTETAGRMRAAGDAESNLAGVAKERFLVFWNDIAGRHGLPARSRQEI